MKAVLVVLSDEVADDVARLFHGCLTMNGYGVQGPPSVIDWPSDNDTSAVTRPAPDRVVSGSDARARSVLPVGDTDEKENRDHDV